MHDSTESDGVVHGSTSLQWLRPAGERLSMTVQEFADLVGVSRATAFKLVKDEDGRPAEVESFKIGARRFIHYDAYAAYIDRRVKESRREKASA